MTKFSHHREQIEETFDQLRELINKLQVLENQYRKQEETLFVISEFANDWESCSMKQKGEPWMRPSLMA